MSNIDKIVSEYNTDFISILNMAADHFTKDKNTQEQIKRAKERLILAKNLTGHSFIIDVSGQYMIKYKDMINSHNLSGFDEKKLAEEIKALKKEDKTEPILRFFGFAKRLYDELDDTERELLFSKLESLLRNYLMYAWHNAPH